MSCAYCISQELMFENLTRNQHFISQAEQRLNALNPTEKKERQRIYEFLVSDREIPTLRLTQKHGRKIESTLSFDDLFSFDIAGQSNLRSNLETLFGAYEHDLIKHSEQLLLKLRTQTTADLKSELLNLFAGKFLNFLRNPYGVKKILNTVGTVANYSPTDQSLHKIFSQVQSGSRPRQKEICETFGLDDAAYQRWLTALFLLLANQPKPNLFESTLKGLFEANWVLVQVYEFTQADQQHYCLLSDRGYNTLFASNSGVVFEFNVTSRAFIRFCFFDPLSQIPLGTRPELVAGLVAPMKGRILVKRFENDLPELARYNQLTAYQCASRVYCASVSPLLNR